MSQLSLLKPIPAADVIKKAAALGPKKIIETIKASGLRGRGGAGFPTGLKWELSAAAAGNHVVVCNADEGEVGTFKDRELITKYPQTLLTGMAVGAMAIEAKEAIIYLRGEYAQMRPDLEKQIESFKSVSDVQFRLCMGAGAYVCGEETALLDSLEGKRGEARTKPPYPVQEGYLGRPTVINNVETFCCAALILLHGASAFAAVGTKKSTGPKLFSVSGDVENPGVYEFPMGVSIQKVLDTVGAKDTKAVIAGGASGICVPKKEFDRILAFEDVAPGGAIIVLNKTRKMLDVLKNIAHFFVEESCGLCVPCREGNHQLAKLIHRLKENEPVSELDLKRHIQLAETMSIAAKCGLGQASVNVFLSTIKHFQDELVSVRS